SYMGISFFILGMIFFTIGLINFVIPTIGVFLYYVSIAFYLYFFKIETDKKAYELIEKGNYLTPEECELAKEVLKAYKLTYIASFAIVLAKLIENFKAYKKKYE
ncbi:MAG: zinc metallopeptidase, partial [Defluviitaleaceae bacterium]|nr:zinc metallopeptidase [Defluviitaleaceae bacterium]